VGKDRVFPDNRQCLLPAKSAATKRPEKADNSKHSRCKSSGFESVGAVVVSLRGAEPASWPWSWAILGARDTVPRIENQTQAAQSLGAERQDEIGLRWTHDFFFCNAASGRCRNPDRVDRCLSCSPDLGLPSRGQMYRRRFNT
jgi:hypothetical protein